MARTKDAIAVPEEVGQYAGSDEDVGLQESEEEENQLVIDPNDNGIENGSSIVLDQAKDSPFGVWSSETAEKKGLKVLLYGPSGSGKTRMAATFPRPLFLDLESGLRTTLQVKPVLRFPADPKEEIHTLDQVKEFYRLVKNSRTPNFETIVVDSLTELQVLVSKNVLGKYDANRQYDDQMTMADYGKANRDFLNIIRLFLKLPYHIVFTAVSIQVDDPELQVYPKFVGKQIGPDLQRIMEMVGYCHVVKGKEGNSEHLVSFKMSPKYVAKDRMGIVEKDIPNDYEYLARYATSEN